MKERHAQIVELALVATTKMTASVRAILGSPAARARPTLTTAPIHHARTAHLAQTA